MLLSAPPAAGRGPYLEEPPWYGPALADTSLAIGFGSTWVRGDTTATLLRAALAPLRRGPLRLAATWSFVSVRTAAGRAFGFGDPRVFTRMRLAGSDTTRAVLHLEGAARLPTAQAALHPFATGGQELELGGSAGVRLGAFGGRAGAGYIWSEPPSGGRLRSSDVPHALHAWALLVWRRGGWAARLSAHELWMEGGRRRSVLFGDATHLVTAGLRFVLAGSIETGPEPERALDSSLDLLFAMPLR